MQPIQAIICFNGGSAGDLVKKLALLCYDVDVGAVHKKGLVNLPQYFKKYFINVWEKDTSTDKIDWSKVALIENSHYYHDVFGQIAQRLFFINYEDSINPVILSEYIRKRFDNSADNFLARHIHSLPAALQPKVNALNCTKVFEIQWMKNIKSWRSNPNLVAIDFYDILQRDTALKAVENVANATVKNIEKFDAIYNQWHELNSTFIQLIR